MAIDADGQMVGQLIMEIHDRRGDTSGPPSFQDILSRLQTASLRTVNLYEFEKTMANTQIRRCGLVEVLAPWVISSSLAAHLPLCLSHTGQSS